MKDLMPGFEAWAPSGSKLQLPDVTLICVDTAYPEMALRAVRHCMQLAEFGAAVLITRADHQLADLPPGLKLETTDTVHSVADYSRFVLRELAPRVQTSHCLVVQWDGFIVDTSFWRPQFLEFDYIGAVLPRNPPGYRVGNGGFSLRSQRLLTALLDPDITQTHPEDKHLALTYRDLLEQRHGIRFADETTARLFSVENARSQTATFGLHGLHAVHWLLQPRQFRAFIADMPQRLFRGAGSRQLLEEAIARGEGELALEVMRNRRRYRKHFWSGLDLWLPVWWVWLRSRLRARH